MKGFIEITLPNDAKASVNINNITDFATHPKEGRVYMGFNTDKDDIVPIKESYEQVKQLIRNAQ